MPNLHFYTNPQSRGRIVRWMLEEVGEAYETHCLGYGTSMKDPSYLAINPMGKVPALVHDKRIITECPAICAYLADTFPKAQLAPPISERHDYYRWLFFAAGPLEAAITNRTLGVDLPEGKQRMVGYGTYQDTIDTLAQVLADRPYIGGPEFSAADVYVGSHVGFGLQFESLPKHPHFESYWKRLSERPALVRANQKDDELVKSLDKGTG